MLTLLSDTPAAPTAPTHVSCVVASFRDMDTAFVDGGKSVIALFRDIDTEYEQTRDISGELVLEDC